MIAPLLSIITVNYNNKSGLIRTLNSIKNQESVFFDISSLMLTPQMEVKTQSYYMKKKLHFHFIGYQSLIMAFMTE